MPLVTRIFLVFVFIFCSFKASGQYFVSDSTIFIIRNISFDGKICPTNDSTLFSVRTYGITTCHGLKNPVICSDGIFLRCIVFFAHEKNKPASADKRMDLVITPAAQASAEQLIITGTFYANQVYVLDTLVYCCGWNWLEIPKPNEISGDTIHLLSHSVTNRYIAQQTAVIDSVMQVRLKQSNGRKVIRHTAIHFQCADSITSSIDLQLTKHKTLSTDFYANGNLNRVYTSEKYTQWKWFYRHAYFDDRDKLHRKFYLLKKLHLVRYIDTCTNYFPSGKIYQQVTSLTDNPNVGYKIVNAWDTNGVQTLFNGNGFCIEYELWGGYDSYSIKHYKNYQPDGTYECFRKGKKYYSAEYKNGVLYNVHSWSEHGSRIIEYDPAADTYFISDFDDNGKLTSKNTFSRKVAEIGFPADYHYIYYYPDPNDRPQ